MKKTTPRVEGPNLNPKLCKALLALLARAKMGEREEIPVSFAMS